jgi:hypothetical protein
MIRMILKVNVGVRILWTALIFPSDCTAALEDIGTQAHCRTRQYTAMVIASLVYSFVLAVPEEF